MRLAHQFQGQTVKVRIRGGRGHTVSAESGCPTACLVSDSGRSPIYRYNYRYYLDYLDNNALRAVTYRRVGLRTTSWTRHTECDVTYCVGILDYTVGYIYWQSRKLHEERTSGISCQHARAQPKILYRIGLTSYTGHLNMYIDLVR